MCIILEAFPLRTFTPIVHLVATFCLLRVSIQGCPLWQRDLHFSQFLVAVDPEIVVISVGADNPFGHPDQEVVDRLINRLGEEKVYRTDRDGTVEFITDGERLWVKAERQKEIH